MKKKRERKRERNIIQQRSITDARYMVENALLFSALRLFLKSVGQLSLCKSYGKRLSYTVKLVEFQKGCCRIDASIEATRNLSQTQRSIWGCNGPWKKLRFLRERMRTFVQRGASVACAKCMAPSAHQYSRFSS